MSDQQGGRLIPRVTLVGAGPGDPGLLTVRGLQCIHEANVVLFDALVSSEILKEIPAAAISINVGKRAGAPSMPQGDINDLIVSLARKHGHVVRLKGGDPFVFGRGFEELTYATEHGLAVAVVPGISSAIAAPSSINIPLTSRGLSEGFFVFTGTTRDEEVSPEVHEAVKLNSTIVILMGLGSIGEIMREFIRAGKHDLPVAVIENATMPTERSVIGVVSEIEEKVRTAGIQPPAVIVVGDVVRAAHELKSVASSVVRSK